EFPDRSLSVGFRKHRFDRYTERDFVRYAAPGYDAKTMMSGGGIRRYSDLEPNCVFTSVRLRIDCEDMGFDAALVKNDTPRPRQVRATEDRIKSRSTLAACRIDGGDFGLRAQAGRGHNRKCQQ